MGTFANISPAGSCSLYRNDAGTPGKSGTRLTQPVRATFITDDELRARYGDDAELLIDALDRKVETQKFANFSRDREAVEHAESMSHPDPDDERDRRRDDAMMGD